LSAFPLEKAAGSLTIVQKPLILKIATGSIPGSSILEWRNRHLTAQSES
jgi:hypothetical protein